LITFTVNTPEGLASIEYFNVTTQESLSMSTAWTAGDTVSIDTDAMRCYLNGIVIDYDGVFPRHVLGFNKVRTVLTSASKVTVTQALQNGQYYLSYIDKKIGQSFDPTATGTLTTVSFALGKMGTSNLSVGVYLYSDSGGSPNTVLQYLGNITNISNIGSGTFPYYVLSSGYSVSNGTTYWIVLQDPTIVAGSEILAGFKTGNVYAGGTAKILQPGTTTWTEFTTYGVANDFRFEIEVQPAFSVNYDWDISYRKRFV
jgi:hypothetical protein